MQLPLRQGVLAALHKAKRVMSRLFIRAVREHEVEAHLRTFPQIAAQIDAANPSVGSLGSQVAELTLHRWNRQANLLRTSPRVSPPAEKPHLSPCCNNVASDLSLRTPSFAPNQLTKQLNQPNEKQENQMDNGRDRRFGCLVRRCRRAILGRSFGQTGPK